MILSNPKDGAAITKFVVEGELWNFAVGETLEFPDKVAEKLQEVFGFLKEVFVLSVLRDEELNQYRCSVCGFARKEKIAVEGHLIKHEGVRGKVEKATPLGSAIPNPTIMQARQKKTQTFEELQNGRDRDGVEFYGEGYQESRPGALNLGGVPGRFGAAQ